MQERLAALAVTPGGGPASELAARMKREMERYRAVAKAANIQAE